MAIPDYQSLMLPLLELAGDNKMVPSFVSITHSLSDMISPTSSGRVISFIRMRLASSMEWLAWYVIGTLAHSHTRIRSKQSGNCYVRRDSASLALTTGAANQRNSRKRGN